VISPLLSNIYLHPLDLYWEREVKATKMVRYADDLVVLCRWRPPELYMPKLRKFLARLRVTVNEDKTRIVDAQDGFDFLGVHFLQAALAARRQPVVLLLLAVATLDAGDSGQGESGHWPRQPPVARREVGPAQPHSAGLVGLLRLAQLGPTFSESGPIRHVEAPALVAGETSAQTASVLANAAGLVETGRPVLDSGSYCVYELNAAGGRLPESRMKENFTYGSMRGRWRRSYGTE
jgi:hypothetical protein